MEIPTNAIIIIVIAAIALAVIMAFLFQSSGGSMDRAQAERVFGTQCVAYAQQACDWSITYRPDFAEYMKACRTLYGEYRDSYSCMYTLCNSCYETDDLKCAGLCNICNGHEAASVDRQSCCSRFEAQCKGTTVDCSAC
jgi:hypothetical protein